MVKCGKKEFFCQNASKGGQNDNFFALPTLGRGEMILQSATRSQVAEKRLCKRQIGVRSRRNDSAIGISAHDSGEKILPSSNRHQVVDKRFCNRPALRGSRIKNSVIGPKPTLQPPLPAPAPDWKKICASASAKNRPGSDNRKLARHKESVS